MSRRFSTLTALLCASLAAATAMAGGPNQISVSTRPVIMEHVTVETSAPYRLVTSRLENEVKRFDASYRTLLENNKVEELRAKLTQGLEPNGFMIHFVAEQGDLLALQGKRQQGNVYYLGNVIAAAEMTRLNFSAALYAPLRLNVYANTGGGTTFEYDKPSTEFGQFHNAAIDKVARSLDERMLRLIRKVST